MAGPRAARWYQSIAASSQTPGRDASSAARSMGSAEWSSIEQQVQLRAQLIERQFGRAGLSADQQQARAAAAPSAGARPASPAAAGAAGCAPPPNRRRVRSRTPCSTASSADRTRSCTTTTCCGSAYRHDGGVRTRRARGSGSSSRQASAALGAPVLEHGAPGAGAHPGAKAVLAGTTAVVGLECTLQRRPPRRPGHDDQAGWPGTLTRLDQGCALPRTPTAQG